MSCSESSVSSSDSDSVEYYSEEGSSINEADGCYGFEPEFNSDEIQSSSSDENLSSNEEDSSRLENLHWCYCRKCVIGLTFTLDECKCCQCLKLTRV